MSSDTMQSSQIDITKQFCHGDAQRPGHPLDDGNGNNPFPIFYTAHVAAVDARLASKIHLSSRLPALSVSFHTHFMPPLYSFSFFFCTFAALLRARVSSFIDVVRARHLQPTDGRVLQGVRGRGSGYLRNRARQFVWRANIRNEINIKYVTRQINYKSAIQWNTRLRDSILSAFLCLVR